MSAPKYRRSLAYLDEHVSNLDGATYHWVTDNLWKDLWELLDNDPRI